MLSLLWYGKINLYSIFTKKEETAEAAEADEEEEEAAAEEEVIEEEEEEEEGLLRNTLTRKSLTFEMGV